MHSCSGCDLAAQVVGHGRAGGLVLRIPVVAEGLAFCVENAGAIIRRHVLVQAAQHVEHAVDGAGRLARLGAQIGQRVKGAIEIGRGVDQQKRFHFE